MLSNDFSLRGCAVVLIGVSGCGKSTLGSTLARRFNVPFVEGDLLHPASNVAKMKSGAPLSDADRWPWLDAIGTDLAALQSQGVVASCSALRRIYRDRLRLAVGDKLIFLCLHGRREVLVKRLERRKRHFMPATLLDSQLETFELPKDENDVVKIDLDQDIAIQIQQASSNIREMQALMTSSKEPVPECGDMCP